MRLSGAPSSRFLRATLAGAATAVALGGALAAAPAANAAIRPDVTAGMGCIAESVGAAEGTVDCNVTPGGGIAPYTVVFTETGGNIGYTSATEVIVYCNRGTTVSVTATVSDSTGASTQVHSVRNCKVGVPIP